MNYKPAKLPLVSDWVTDNQDSLVIVCCTMVRLDGCPEMAGQWRQTNRRNHASQ